MLIKKHFGQFYTKNAEYILKGLIDDFDPKKQYIDPFAGEGDLLRFFPNSVGYDIDVKTSTILYNDSLKNPKDYSSQYIITNPPYLAKNKNNDKTYYLQYGVNDLYKASMKSIMSCEGGILIIPLNFFCDEDDTFRRTFLSKYRINKINIFEESVFDDTDNIICAFSFISDENMVQTINPVFYPSKTTMKFILSNETGYKIGDNFFKIISNINSKFYRLQDENDNCYTNIYLTAVDTGSLNGRIKLSYCNEPYVGKSTDRAFATICYPNKISEEIQLYIIEKFNETLEKYRKEYRSMFLTNFRNSTKQYSRKRLSFDIAYKLIQYIYDNRIIR